MTNIGTPNVNVGSKSTEQNLQILKSWAIETAEAVNYQFSQFESTISALQEEIESLKEGQE